MRKNFPMMHTFNACELRDCFVMNKTFDYGFGRTDKHHEDAGLKYDL